MTSLCVGLIAAGWRPERGGVETVTAALADELVRRGHRVHALALDRRGARPEGALERTRDAGVELTRVAWTFARDERVEDLAGAEALRALALRWAGDAALDVAHVHALVGFGAALVPRLAALGVPVALTAHDYELLCPRGQMWHVDGGACAAADPERCAACVARTWPHLAGRERAAQVLARRLDAARDAWRACARVYAPSAAALRVLVAHGLDEARAVVCENGLVAREPHPRTPRTGALRVGVLGAVQPSKGVLELARLVAADARCELHVHGPRGAYHGDRAYVDALEALAARTPNVRLHGAYAPDELPAVLAGLDVVAVPSRWNEVYGLIAREARAAGLPVLASRVGGLVEAGVTLLAPDDAEAWRCALDALAAGRGAPPDARAPRSAAALADQLEADYLELAARCDRATTR